MSRIWNRLQAKYPDTDLVFTGMMIGILIVGLIGSLLIRYGYVTCD